MTISLANKISLGQIAGTYQRQLVLDTVCTEHLAHTSSHTAEDISHLQSLVKEMDDLFVQAEQEAHWLISFIDANPDDFSGMVSKNLGSIEANKKHISEFRRIAEEHGGFASFAKRATASLVELAPKERQEMRSKVRSIVGGGSSFGD